MSLRDCRCFLGIFDGDTPYDSTFAIVSLRARNARLKLGIVAFAIAALRARNDRLKLGIVAFAIASLRARNDRLKFCV